MKRTILASCVALAAFGANAASLEDLSIGGFGSVGIGKADNDVGYAGYTDDNVEWEQETLAGIQFDFQVNDRAKFVTQIVANSQYDYDPKFEMAYLAYEFDSFTARAGKLRLPLFFYSDYIDLGYAYPMLRPSQETYQNIVLKGYTGAELLIPVDFDESTLLIQPVVGIGTVDEDDSRIGEVKLNKLMGLSASWNYEDITLRGSYFRATADPQCTDSSDGCNLSVIAKDKDGQFISLGAQYDNGDLLVNVEGTDVQLDGKFYDTRSLSGLVGYRIGEFTPYIASSWVETTDDDERPEPSLALAVSDQSAYQTALALNKISNYERISYSLGSRWDFYQNMALKFDVTYVDYKDTSGGYQTNINSSYSEFLEQDTFVYSARLDFVF